MTFGSKSINSSQTLPSNLSPHLYKLFRNSKGNLNSTNLDETTTTTATTTSTSGSDLSFQLNSSLNRQSRKVPNETQNKKTSFSQLRQRSLSSCAIASNPTTTESPKMKKSIGTQHEPQETDKSPTILCMVVDKNNKLNKKDILIAAAKAKAMANQSGVLKIQKTNSSSKRSSSLFNTKHSLPDLTFLTHYSDKKPEVTPCKPSPNLQTVPNDLLKRKTLKSIKRYRQTKQNTEPCAVQIITPPKKIEENSEIIFERRPSLPFNERGKNQINTLNGKQPLKSCLKRKESQTLKHSQSLQPNFTKNHEKILKLKSTMMFVPLVGYLFSCDTDSSTRYFYYNNLEKNRISKIYKQLTNEVTDENESEENTEGEEDEKTFENSKKNDITRSDNDLRIKKIVKFKLIKLKKETLMRKEPPPLLQYEALIAMLKSSKDKKITAPNSLNLVKNSNTIEADSISLASLSESPPSEFKFSDDEENLNHSINTKTNVHLVNQKLEHLKNLKKNFHSILLQDSKLNNLKEILLELKTQQEKLGTKFDSSTTSSTSFSGNSSSTSTCSSITSPLNSSSCEMKESIERLAGYLFDILKQSIKPPSGDCLLPTSNLFKSTIESPLLNLKKPNQLADSNTLTQNFSQYTQVWNLIECTMNANLELQRQPLGVGENLNVINKCFFNLPKEAYLTMFQEINKFASSTNQTYLIDNSINTSQLRRKHHFMVMLMSLKFKFQLFIVYLLNHKQLANWFDHINRDKNLLKTFYEFKQNFKNLANNSSGDSGMGNEFMQISTSSSTCSSSLSNSMTQNQSPLVNINESNFNVKSLSNVSVFENDEYFSYFHKLLQQFNQIEIKLHTPQHSELPTKPNHPPTPPPPPPLLQQKPPQQQSNIQQTVKSQAPPTPNINRLKQPETKSILNRNHIPKPVLQNNPNVQNHKKSNSNLSNQQNLVNHHQTGSSNHSNGGFNLKNISKRFNIKSWFTSHTHSNSNIPIPTSASHNNFASTTGTNSRLPIGIKTLAPNTSRFGNKKNTRRDSSVLKVCDGNGVLGSGVGALISNNSSNNLMKHSLSEPSLNKILDR
ncbi:unnamed protein product [Brachionus calyciflorus]|uniref:RUN domain-containing protein n=1 Tax=Brachionus calyciflorus TaxID=104777 RepID=A0A813XAA8_9BILA|nr:unnamed protein product [Brachionus calyciflorus]